MSLHAAAIPVVVVSDFGRDAALRFCTELAQREQEAVATRLPAGAPFYDEYRRMALFVVGDLGFIKAPWLASYAAAGRPFDEGVLVGFPGGPTTDEVAGRIAVLVVEALAGSAARGQQRAVVALPCNTLTPVARTLRQAFASTEELRSLVEQSGCQAVGLDEVAERLAGRIEFPTVPQAVLWRCAQDGSATVLPLGTPGIGEAYRQAAAADGTVTIVTPDPSWQVDVLEAIQASIAGDDGRRERSLERLRAIRDEARARWGSATAVIEACTDLDYGVGLDSGRQYARYLVHRIYGPGDPSADSPAG